MKAIAESRSHRRNKYNLAGTGGKTEVRLPSGMRLDALNRRRVAGEVERQGNAGIRKAVSRLKEAKQSGIANGAKIAVPDWDMAFAIREMFRQGVFGRVQNLSNTRSFYTGKKRR